MSLKENPDVNSSMDLGEEYPKRAMEVRGDESRNKVQFWKKSKGMYEPQTEPVYAGPDITDPQMAPVYAGPPISNASIDPQNMEGLGIPQYMMMVYAGPDSISFKNAMLLKEQQQTNKCPKCGNPNQDSANYCTNCGNKLKD